MSEMEKITQHTSDRISVLEQIPLISGHRAILPVPEIDEQTCFRITTEDGTKCLAWVQPQVLSGISDQDKSQLFPDSHPAKDLKHPNILQPQFVTRTEDLIIFITKDFQGQSLLRFMGVRKHDEDTFRKVLDQLSDGVEHAHQHGVIHRSLNPANILINQSGELVIFGFGLSNLFFNRWIEKLEEHGASTHQFLPPEILNDGMTAGKAHSDIFSIGRICYKVLMGDVPAHSADMLPSQVCDVPSYFDDALLNSMHGDPERRPRNVEEMRQWFNGERYRDTEYSNASGRLSSATSTQPRKPTWLEGQLSWITHPSFIYSVIFLALLGGFLAWLVHEQNKMENVELIVDEEVTIEEMLSRWKELTPEQIAELYEQYPEKFMESVSRMYHVLTSEDNFDDAKEFIEKIASASDYEPDAREQLDKMLADLEEWEEIEAISQFADYSGNAFGDEMILARAVELFPQSPLIQETHQNKLVFKTVNLLAAIEKLKRLNPRQKKWSHSIFVDDDRVRLDLSEHGNLVDISPLKGQEIHELLLSGTGIRTIDDLRGLPIDELQIDRTAVHDLTPLINTPLRVICFRRTLVEDITTLTHLRNLRCALGVNAEGDYMKILPPLRDQKTWINGHGVKFRRLPGSGVLMAEREYRSAPEISTPLTRISFREANQKCTALTTRDRANQSIAAHHRYRLPTDAEWSRAVSLPESPFLTLNGRQLQVISPSDHREYLKSETLLDACFLPMHDANYHQNGWFGLQNGIGEWVLHDESHLNPFGLARGTNHHDSLISLRSRRTENPDKPFSGIGFRPVLEIEGPSEDFDRIMANNMPITELVSLSIDTARNLHLRAAAMSSLRLKRLNQSKSYQDLLLASNGFQVNPFGSERYMRVDLPMTWTEARKMARRFGGRLATVKNKEHLIWLQAQFVEGNPLGTPVWTGASFFPGKASWVWENEEPVPFSVIPPHQNRHQFRMASILGGPKKDALMPTTLKERFSFIIEWDSTVNPLFTFRDQ